MEQPVLQNPGQSNAAKFAFFYLLSLVALIFMSLSTGIIIFQIINKNIPDIAPYIFPGGYDSGALKFAISAIIISAPIYYSMMTLINKSLYRGSLVKDAPVRRWLTYFILLISAVVMIGWLIATIYSFLDGELTTKFVLKALTAIIIAAAIFSYYFYDIRREEVVNVKNKVISIFFYASLAVVVITLVSSFFFVESPAETRARKQDNAILNNFNQIDSAINTYYFDNSRLPANLNELVRNNVNYYITERELKNPATQKPFDYKILGADSYELCTDFTMSNKEKGEDRYAYYDQRWQHDAGYQCLTQKVRTEVKPGVRVPEKPLAEPIRVIE